MPASTFLQPYFIYHAGFQLHAIATSLEFHSLFHLITGNAMKYQCQSDTGEILFHILSVPLHASDSLERNAPRQFIKLHLIIYHMHVIHFYTTGISREPHNDKRTIRIRISSR